MPTDRLVKVTSDRGEETIERVPEGTLDDLRKTGVDVEDPKTGQKNTGRPVYEAITPEDGRNVAMELAKCLRDALREHGDEMKAIYLANSTNEGVTIKIQYMPDDQGNADEDEFVFRWGDGKLRLDNVANPVDLCDLQKQSGQAIIQKDLVKNALLNFLKSHDNVGAEDTKQPTDPNALPDGPVAEEKLWESDECQEAFCKAVYNFQNCPENKKEAIKNLLRAARPYQKGNTIQEKLKGAVEWYNIYKENPPKNTEKQVFLEGEQDLQPILDALLADFDKLKSYINTTEDLHVGSYYRSMREIFDRMYAKFQSKGVDEMMDLDDPIAKGATTNDPNQAPDDDPYWNTEDDSPVMGEGDEIGPEVGDEVEYEGGNYRLYGYCGYEVVLQNVDDEREFKIVKPEQAGIGSPKTNVQETQWVDPDDLPSQK